MQLNIKYSLSKVKIYGRYLSEFLLPDQVDILAKSLQKDIEQKLILTDVVSTSNCEHVRGGLILRNNEWFIECRKCGELY